MAAPGRGGLTWRPPDVAGSVRLEASVRGVVQGVGFRWFVMREARSRNLTGWVANEHDGSVRIVAEGAPADVAGLRSTLEVGPAGAVVERVSAVEMPATGGFSEFSLRSAGHTGD